MKVVFSHLTGSPFSRNAALAIHEQKALHEVVTAFGFKNDAAIERILSRIPGRWRPTLKRELGRRNWGLPEEVRFSRHAAREGFRAVLSALKVHRYIHVPHDKLINANAVALDRAVARHHLDGADAVYCFEDTAAETFAAARRRGLTCLYDLPIMHYKMSRAIMAEEIERFPAFRDGLQAAQEPDWKIARKEQEVELAHHIYVASSITLRSLLSIGVPREKISVIPYGGPVHYFHPTPREDGPFRAMFVGLVGPRKGAHYFLQAWKELKLTGSELMMVGALQFPREWFEKNAADVKYVPSVPHSTLSAYYNMANVFVFPSLVEGFAMVLLEAMACGVPIITTPNTAGPDIITDGVEGFIVPIRDVAALKEKIQWCHDHPDELREMGIAARKKAEQLTWDRYRQLLGQNVVETVSSLRKG